MNAPLWGFFDGLDFGKDLGEFFAKFTVGEFFIGKTLIKPFLLL